MSIKYPSMRQNLVDVLCRLSDLDYQQAVWLDSSQEQIRDSEYDYFDLTTKSLLDDFIWDAAERLIGAIFRDTEELEASLDVVKQLSIFLQTKTTNQGVDMYINDPDWLLIVATARNAIRILHRGDK